MIEIFGTELFQWDTGRSVKVTEIEADHVHFANKGDSKAVIMEIADGIAKIPNYLLQTGKQLCVYAVKNGVTVESKIFYVKNRERPENYVYEEDQRNYIYELITNAQTAIEVANHAAEEAVQAVAGANTASNNANVATQNANAAANSAALAAKNADEAADNAAHMAKSLMVIGSAKGNSIHLDDAIDQFLVGMRIFGKTTQDGTPSPDNPVELVSVGNSGSITVNVVGENASKSMSISTPNGLPGIPVTSGGNYTDSNGQQWICDEIDFSRGVYVHRTKSGNLYEYVDRYCAPISNTQYSENVLRFDFGNVFDSKVHTKALCNRFVFRFAHGVDIPTVRVQEGVSTHSTGDFISVFIDKNRLASATLAGLKEYLQNNATIVLCAINTPIETPLTDEEIAAYAALRTYRGNTTISNSGHAYMDLEYVMDAKRYIDSQISARILEATVE